MSTSYSVHPLKRLMLVPAASLTMLLAACGSGGQPVAVPQTSTQPATSSAEAGGSVTDVTTSSDSTTGSTEDSSTEQSATAESTLESSANGSSEQSSTEEASTEQSSTEQSSTDESTTEASTTEESSTAESTTDESTTDESTTEESSTAESTTDESTTSSSTSSSSQPARTSPGSSGGAPAAAVKIAAPGTKLKIGQTAILHKQILESSNPRHTLGVIEATVTKIQKVDPKIFEKLKNKADFKGLTPYYIFVDYKLIAVEGNTETGGTLTPVITGVLKDGSDAGMAIGFGGGLQGCEDKFFEDNKVGDTATLCYTALAETKGAPVTGAQWEGDDYADGSGPKNKYRDNPVVWTQ